MHKAAKVLEMLIPTGGWAIQGDDFDSIHYDEGVTPLTKKQFDDGFNVVDAWIAEQEAVKAAEKAALLARLGITADEAMMLLS
jgi:hypothetical protein